MLREGVGREASPTAAIVDTQSVLLRHPVTICSHPTSTSASRQAEVVTLTGTRFCTVRQGHEAAVHTKGDSYKWNVT